MSHPAFEAIRSHRVDSLNLDVVEYRHRVTGAMHYHLAAPQEENVFLVALRTVPQDSTGVAHILEHTVLCGSERYPVRDPFFTMLRRSLNTFMNAFTSSDWTAYPFASQNRRDFDNLLQVYLDAVFFPRLDPLDFAQEGHRVEFAEPEPDSPLVYKGVVFNEMKGAMSSVPSTLWQTLCEHLFPTNTYHYNSGGDPEQIPRLSYEQLRDFHATHYHPANAIFMTFGDIAAADHQARFEELALKRFEPLDVHIAVPREKRYPAPIEALDWYALDESESGTAGKTHVVVGWLLGESADLDDVLAAQLLSSILLDNSSSPLQHALESSELGSAPSPLCGLEDSLRELVFVCGLEGCEPESAAEVEVLILDTLRQVAAEGVAPEQVEAMLHQLELHQREIGGDGFPYGLQLIMTALSSATHRGDPIAVLDLDPALERLRKAAADPAFIPDLIEKLLLGNNHRVRLTLAPDANLARRRVERETAELAQRREELDEAGRREINERAEALNQRQNESGDESILPKVGLEDVPPDIPELAFATSILAGMPATSYARGTNGLVYQQLLMRLPSLGVEALNLLQLYTQVVSELGVGELDYRATQSWQSRVCGSLSAYTTMRGAVDNEQEVDSWLVFSSKALARNAAAQTELLGATVHGVRFDERAHIRELVAQQRARREASVSQNGHVLAMHAACSGMSPGAELTHNTGGLAGLARLKALDTELTDATALAELSDELERLHHQLSDTGRQLLLIGESESLPALHAAASDTWPTAALDPAAQRLRLASVRHSVREWWLADTQVNFCARAFPTVPSEHPDAAPLTVLGGFLRNGYLHRAIREQGGAYGGGASQDSGIAAFRFFSYRDPRLEETLADFDAALEWLAAGEHGYEPLEQAILGVISGLDRPASPAGEAKQDFHNRLFGRTPEQRRRFRERILATTVADLKRVGAEYLRHEVASTALVTGRDVFESKGAGLQQLGFELRQL